MPTMTGRPSTAGARAAPRERVAARPGLAHQVLGHVHGAEHLGGEPSKNSFTRG
jgi:hypothetical protein